MTTQETHELALQYYEGSNGKEKDLKRAYELFLQAANDGHIEACANAGFMLENGEGVERDLEKAEYWLSIATAGGHHKAKAEYRIVKSFRKSMKVLLATAGSLENQLELAYESYCDEEYAEALKWYTAAAEQGDAYAYNQLGMMYSFGEGVEVNQEKAVEYFLKAFDKDYEIAAYNLGIAYEGGSGVDIDYTKAVKYYTFAAERGFAPAMAELSFMYSDGRGVEADSEKAEYWLNAASKANKNI